MKTEIQLRGANCPVCFETVRTMLLEEPRVTAVHSSFSSHCMEDAMLLFPSLSGDTRVVLGRQLLHVDWSPSRHARAGVARDRSSLRADQKHRHYAHAAIR